MKIFEKKPSRPFLITLSLIAVPVLILGIAKSASLIRDNITERRFQNEDFQQYESTYNYCASFYGGHDESREDIYKRWEANDPISC